MKSSNAEAGKTGEREGMVELIIEKWGNLDGSAGHFWSVWRDGRRIEMSDRMTSTESAESQGRLWCEKSLGQAPDRITRL